MLIVLTFFGPILSGTQTYSDVSREQTVLYPWAGAPNGTAPTTPTIHFDQAWTFYPWQIFMSRAQRGGDLPFWNPDSFAGTPFLANGQNGFLNPVRLAIAPFVSASRVHDLLLMLECVGASLAMYALCLYFGTSWLGAIAGAIAWTFNSFAGAWLALEHFGAVMVGLPLAVLATHACLARRSLAACLLLAASVGYMMIAGNVLFVIVAAAMILLYGICLAARALFTRARDESSHILAGISLATAGWLLGGALAAVVLLPTAEVLGGIARESLGYTDLQAFAVAFTDTWKVLLPPTERAGTVDVYHSAFFAGTGIAVLAAFGAASRLPGSWLARTCVVGAAGVALGTPLLAAPYFLLPGFNSFKPLGRVLFLYQFGLALLAAFGASLLVVLIRRVVGPRNPRWATAAGVVVVSALVVTSGIQLHTYFGHVQQTQPAQSSDLYPATPLVKALLSESPRRILPLWPSMPGSIPLVYPLPNALGYDSSLPERTQNVWRAVLEDKDMEELAANPLRYAYQPRAALATLRLDLLARTGVTHVVAPPLVRLASEGPVQVLEGSKQLRVVYDGPDGRVYRTTGATPRAFLVDGCIEAPNDGAALDTFLNPAFDPSRAVILERSAILRLGEPCSERGRKDAPPGRVFVTGQGLNTLVMQTSSRRTAWLVVMDSYDPGWSAEIDGGESAEILPANYAFRALRLPAGRHTVRLRYVPPGWDTGQAVSLCAVAVLGILAAVMIVRSIRRRVVSEEVARPA